MLPSNSNPSNPLSFEHETEDIRSGRKTPFSCDQSKEAVVGQPSNQFVNQCPICFRKFSKAFIFQRHVVSRNCSTVFPCKLCGNEFKSRATLVQHWNAIHSNDHRPLKCSDCDKTFNRASSLSQHRKIHSPEKDFVCSICGAGFHQKGNLKNHLTVHTKLKPFVCSDCNRPFTKMSNLTHHRKVFHTLEEPAGFRCGICSGLFAKLYLLRSHEQKLHGLVRQEEPKPAPPLMPPIPSITTVVIPAIRTSAIAVAKARGEIPFAVLHMLNEIPLIVRVVEQGKYSVLKAAESSDFLESQRGARGLEEANSVSIAVVATIYQRINEEGKPFFDITGPVSCYQTNKIPQIDQTDEVLQASLGSANLYKTLTQLNMTEVGTNIKPQQKDAGLPAIRPHEVDGPVASTSGNNKLKRKQTPRQQANPTSVPIKRAVLKQPKVIAVMDNPVRWANCGTSPRAAAPRVNERNFQDIATGPLLSPERAATLKQHCSDEVMTIDPEDPFNDINVLDLIRTENELLPGHGILQDINLEDSGEDIYIPVL